jgi:signal transduction histidine kinase
MEAPMDRPRVVEAELMEWVKTRPIVLSVVGTVHVVLMLAVGALPRVIWLSGIYYLFGVVTTSLYVFVIERREAASKRLRTAFLMTSLGVGFLVLISGGLHSPIVVMLLGAPVGAVTLDGVRRTTLIQLATVAAVIVISFLLPPDWSRPIADPLGMKILTAYGVVVFGFVVVGSVGRLNRVLQHTHVALDIARTDCLEATMERKRTLEIMGAKVAHELKNPLAAIKGLIDVETRAATEERSQARLGVMRSEVDRMEQILRDYLSFSRPLEQLELAPVDLASLSDGVLSTLEGRSFDAGVTLTRQGRNVLVRADAKRLKETLLNLISNALEATPRGGAVEVMIDHEPESGAARVTVRDEGRGMSPAVLAKLGTPFFTTRDGGTGLGVVIARTIVQHHGGSLAYASRPSGGTIATVTLPIDGPAHAPPPPQSLSNGESNGVRTAG